MSTLSPSLPLPLLAPLLAAHRRHRCHRRLLLRQGCCWWAGALANACDACLRALAHAGARWRHGAVAMCEDAAGAPLAGDVQCYNA